MSRFISPPGHRKIRERRIRRRRHVGHGDDVGVLERRLHAAIAKVSGDIERLAFNTAIAANMELLNSVSRFEDDTATGHAIRQEVFDSMVLMLAPIMCMT